MNHRMLAVAALGALVALSGTAEAGRIVAWGSNRVGALDVPEGDDFVAIAAGNSHSLALREDGSLVAWGGGVPAGEFEVPQGNDFVYIAVSSFSSYAIRQDGQMVSWTVSPRYIEQRRDWDFAAVSVQRHGVYGDQVLTLLKDGSLQWFGNKYLQEPRVMPEGNDFVAIAGGGGIMALRSDGSVVTSRTQPPIDHLPGNDYVAIALGSHHYLGLRGDGSIAVSGEDVFGMLDVPEGSDFVAIAANYRFGVAIREDGSLAAWGESELGQLDVPEGNRFVAIAAGRKHGLAIEVPEPSALVSLLAAVAAALGLAWRSRQE